jgi:hypothetical protein
VALHILLYGGVCSSSRVCAGVCEDVKLYRITRHVASTYGQSMTNGANYKRGKLYHSPWHSDIRTSNQLNTPRERLSRLFETKNSEPRKQGANQTMWISSKQTCPINIHSDGIHDAISSSNSKTISKNLSTTISESNPETISESNSNPFYRSTLL